MEAKEAREDKEMKPLGNTELSVSAVALGAAAFGAAIPEADAFSILDAYVAAGGNFIDTARLYAGGESERVLGRWLKRGGRAVVATKGAHYDPKTPTVMRLGADEIRADLEESLRALGVDCIDFYFLHRDDPRRPIGEILETMEAFVREGKLRYYGASNYTASRLWEAHAYAAAHGITGFSAVSNQHSFARVNPGRNTNPDPTITVTGEAELLFHRETGIPLVPFQATARGCFAKKAAGSEIPPSLIAAYGSAENERRFARVCAFAEERHCSVQTASLVLMTRENFPVFPITAVRDRSQMADVAAALSMLS
jgi:aryl-alcohol dehydrogenase-like predicted oxidoreductase